MDSMTDHSQNTSMSSVAENGVLTPAAGNSEGASNDMPEQPNPDNRAITGATDHSASAVNSIMEDLMPGDVIFRRVLPETLPTLHFQTAQGFEESGTKDKCIEDSQGIAGVFYLQIHESWRCRMCEYEGHQVWFDREMTECPRCSTAKLEYVDAANQRFRAEVFRDADDGATVFNDVFLGLAGTREFWEMWDRMIAEDSDEDER